MHYRMLLLVMRVRVEWNESGSTAHKENNEKGMIKVWKGKSVMSTLISPWSVSILIIENKSMLVFVRV